MPIDPAHDPSLEPSTAPRDLFDRNRRAIRRGQQRGAEDYFGNQMADMLLERLAEVKRDFADILLIGARNSALIAHVHHLAISQGGRATIIEPSRFLAQGCGAQVADEDHLPVEPASYDLILWPGGLESVNDVPGALLRCRFALRADGLLLGCFIGGGSFPALRSALAAADGTRAVARMHPQIDVRAAGDLLGQCGLALGVADAEQLVLAYRALDPLISDVRAAALTNMLAGPLYPLHRTAWAAARSQFAAAAGAAGRTHERVTIIHICGWAPDPSQPQPARRGSATASLSAALNPRDGSAQA